MIATMNPRVSSPTMAKKKRTDAPLSPHSRVSPAFLRRGNVNTDAMKELVVEAREWLAEIEIVLVNAGQLGITEFEIDGVKKLPKVVEELAAVSSSVYDGLNKARSARRRNET